MSVQYDEAVRLLTLLRTSPFQFNAVISDLREWLAKGELSPEDIGTSDTEIEELCVRWCKTCAEESLTTLRDGHDQPQVFVEALRRYLNAANLKFEDIGTTETELRTFRKIA